jgi:hypothetical protein
MDQTTFTDAKRSMVMNSPNRLYQFLLLVAAALAAGMVQAGDKHGMYAVTVTNLTRGTTITPLMVATHKAGHIFTLGAMASPELSAIAEGGDIQPLSDKLLDSGMAYDVATNGALLPPGESTTIMVKTDKAFPYVSVAAMLIPTNDGFVAVNGVKGPKHKGQVRAVMSPAYDAGSEPNDELCANIPGPVCGGEGLSADAGGEGYVHIHAGIHGIGNLDAASYDWRNPTARITIKRIK